MKILLKKTYIILALIIFLASVLRFYKIGIIPPSITWDEAAVGYNAFTIANYGRDEYSKIFPAFFRSFGDDKHPIHVYTTAIFVKLLGLNDIAIRLPSATFGVLNVLLLFSLAKLIFKSDLIALTAAFFLGISPYNIHFSRFNHEANFALFWFQLALFLFYLSIKKEKNLILLSFLSFAICFITYHPSKIVVPIVIVLLLALYFKQLLINKKSFFGSLFFGLIFSIFIFLNPQLLGFARINQTTLDKREIQENQLFKLTNNQFLGHLNLVLNQYSWHFTPEFLFLKGDKNPRLSSSLGEFYKIDVLFLIAGLIYLLYRRSKGGFILLSWFFIAPLPSALVAEAPHAARSMFMMGSWHLVSAVGFYSLIALIPRFYMRVIFSLACLVILTIFIQNYLNYYYGEFVKRYAIDWQYGMRQIVEYIQSNPEYSQIDMTDVRSQPYIFFLYYLKTPLAKYKYQVLYNNSQSKSYNNVSNFDRYYFGDWDPIESYPSIGVLYIVTPSQYDGLRYKSLFDVKKLIYYPNDVEAFYLISAKQ